MELKEQVCSLELAKRLKELGVKQESLWWWVITSTTNYHLSLYEHLPDILRERNDCYSAFTTAELGEMLPRCMITQKKVYGGFSTDGFPHIKMITEADTEADARAKMMIYLKENKII